MPGDKTFTQIPDDKLNWHPNEESNSIAMVVKHIHDNMLSRWSNSLSSDGEKESRNRDREFDNDIPKKRELINKWEEGWTVLFNALSELKDDELHLLIYIRNMGHTIFEAINRQLAHYPYHIGQIVYLGKLINNAKWTSLSILEGKSEEFNKERLTRSKERKHFTDDL